MSNALLALGPHIFEIAPLNYREVERVTQAIWASIGRFGGQANRQFTGLGDDKVRISGLLWPDEFTGGHEAISALRQSQQAGQPLTMIGWAGQTTGRHFGRYVILSLTDRQGFINRHGLGARLEYDLELAPVPREGLGGGLFL